MQVLAQRVFGGFTLEQHLKYWQNEFRQADADANGVVDAADVALHAKVGGANMRLGRLALIMRADLDGDGTVTEDEMRVFVRYGARLYPPSQNPEQMIETEMRNFKAMDKDGDGRVTYAELMNSTVTDPMYGSQIAQFTSQAQTLLKLAPQGKSSVTLADIEPAVEALFHTVDTDSDGKLSREEVQAYRMRPDQPEGQARRTAERAMRQRERAQRQAEADRAREIAEKNAACAMPKASDSAKVVLFSAYEAEALSNVTLGFQDVAVGVGNITIEPGPEPIYLVVTAFRPTIWRFYGALERIERVVMTATMTGPNRGQPQDKPLAGLTGVPAEKVTFLGKSNCLGYFNETPSTQASAAAAAVKREAGKDVAVMAARYSMADAMLPSGRVQSMKESNQGKLIIVKRSGTLRIEGDSSGVIVQTGRNNLEGDLQLYHPGGVVEFDPKRVVASVAVERYGVLPQEAGLLQLLKSGALVQNRDGDYLIKQKIRFPAELQGAHSVKFLLLRGVPMPDGDPNHCEVISEETGEPIKFGQRG